MSCSTRTADGPVCSFEKPAPAKPALLPLICIVAAVFLWGGSFATMRIALRELPPSTVMWLRMAIAGVILLPFVNRLLPRRIHPGDWKKLLLMVFFQPCCYFLLESNALRLTTSSQAGVVAASVPLLVAAGAWGFLGESVSRRTGVGMVAAVLGVVALMLLSEPPSDAARAPLLGNALELGAMICAAASLLLLKDLSRRYSPFTLTALQVAAGALFFLPGLKPLLAQPLEIWNPGLAAVFIYLGACVTLGAFCLYNWGMSRISASRASVFINLVPVIAVLIGWTALGEGLTASQSLAAVMVVGGVWWSQR